MKEILQEIYEVYLRKLRNLEGPHRKLVIFFSGIPGAGKTSLAKEIEERYRGVRINNDDLRKVVAEIMHKHHLPRNEENNQKILHEALLYFFQKYNGKNGLIIFDSSIDRSWKEKKHWSQEHGYPFFIIRMNTSLKDIQRRLGIRERRNPERNFERLKQWKEDYAKAKMEIKADITINNNDLKEVKELYKKLDALIV